MADSARPEKRSTAAQPQDDTEEDDIISRATGDYGRWQLVLTCLLAFFNVPCTWHIYAPTFHARQRDVWCARPPGFSSVDPILWRNYTQPTDECSMIDPKFVNLIIENGVGSITILPGALSIACNSWEFGGEGDTIISEFSLVCDRKQFNNLAEATFLAGVTIGGFIGGVISDRWGRKKTLMLGVLLQALIGVSVSFSTSVEMYLSLRAALGFVSVSVVFSGFVLVMELVGGKWRTIAGISYLLPVSLSYALIAGMAYFIRDWRHLQLAISLPGLGFLSLWWILPESPRWLLAMGKTQEVMTVLQQAAKFNKRELPHNLDKQLLPTSNRPIESGGVLDLFKTKRMMRITLLLFVIWFSVYLVYYGLVLNMGYMSGDLYLNSVISGLVEVPALAFSIMVLLYMGRRWPLSLTMLFAGCSCLVTLLIHAVVPSQDDNSLLLIIFTMIAKLLISSSNAVMPVFTAELFPTKIRNIGVGASNVPAGIALISVPYLWELATIHNCIPMALLGGCGIIGGVCVLFLPETGQGPLRDDITEESSISADSNSNSIMPSVQ